MSMHLFRRNRNQSTAEPEGKTCLRAEACLSGRVIPMKEIPDPAFAEGILGSCIGIRPAEEEREVLVTAPADGTVTRCSETGHAVGLACGDTEILIHAGIDTVQLSGKGFTLSVKEGETVRTGQPLLRMDTAPVRDAGYDPVVVIVITDTPGKAAFTERTEIRTGEVLFTVSLP